uniref:(northern house mosquito) hypothetical protein n=1 Tax=Culex pipiens TaxID=7175 RepID=A0A8D8BPV5_CULPI
MLTFLIVLLKIVGVAVRLYRSGKRRFPMQHTGRTCSKKTILAVNISEAIVVKLPKNITMKRKVCRILNGSTLFVSIFSSPKLGLNKRSGCLKPQEWLVQE